MEIFAGENENNMKPGFLNSMASNGAVSKCEAAIEETPEFSRHMSRRKQYDHENLEAAADHVSLSNCNISNLSVN